MNVNNYSIHENSPHISSTITVTYLSIPVHLLLETSDARERSE